MIHRRTTDPNNQNDYVTLWADWGLADYLSDWANPRQMGVATGDAGCLGVPSDDTTALWWDYQALSVEHGVGNFLGAWGGDARCGTGFDGI
jgi:hypothetical protein